MNQRKVEIVIVGAGAAGVACALSAAAQGAAVHLVEKTPCLGGTVAHSLIHTIGGLYDDDGEPLNGGLPVALAEKLLAADPHTTKRKMGKLWTLSVDPAVYEVVLERWIAEQSTVTLLREAYPTRVQRAGRRIEAIAVRQGSQTRQLQADAFVDTTGTAELVRLTDATKVVEGDALAGLIFQIRGVGKGALTFPKNVGLQRNLKKAIEAAALPAAFAGTWFDIGVYDDEVYVKLAMPAPAYDPATLPGLQNDLLAFLHQLPDFADAHLVRVGRLGIRDGGRIKGDYCLTVDDVKVGRRFPDAIARCAWPIEYWDPTKGVTLDTLPPQHFYEIPLRALRVAEMDNLWVAGKCLSAEKLAQASARVAGTCWAMGDALGKALTKLKR